MSCIMISLHAKLLVQVTATFIAILLVLPFIHATIRYITH